MLKLLVATFGRDFSHFGSNAESASHHICKSNFTYIGLMAPTVSAEIHILTPPGATFQCCFGCLLFGWPASPASQKNTPQTELNIRPREATDITNDCYSH